MENFFCLFFFFFLLFFFSFLLFLSLSKTVENRNGLPRLPNHSAVPVLPAASLYVLHFFPPSLLCLPSNCEEENKELVGKFCVCEGTLSHSIMTLKLFINFVHPPPSYLL